VERVALRLVRRWRELGIDAPLFLGRTDGDMSGDVGRDLHFIAPKQPSIPIARWETLWMIWTLPRVVRELRPDVLFCAGNTYTIVAVALKFRLGRSCPPILAKISNDLDRHDMRWWQRFAYRLWLSLQGAFLDHVIAMEPAMTGEIEEALGLPSDAITVIPDPALSRTQIDHLRRASRATRAPDAGRRFVAVGRLASQKNLELMLRAFRHGANPHDVLVVIGDGPERAKLTKLAADLGLSDDVELRGYVAEPWALLPEFDALLLSSNYEGVPAVVLEALAARLPVIATDCSRSMRQLLHNGALGTLVPVGDEAAFAEAIARKGLRTPDAALSLAQVCRFTLEDAAEAYFQTMVRLASRTVASAAPSARDVIPLKPAQEPLGDIAA